MEKVEESLVVQQDSDPASDRIVARILHRTGLVAMLNDRISGPTSDMILSWNPFSLCPPVPPVQIPTPATSQMCPQAPGTFDGTNPEDLWTFLLQCQITFNSCPQNFPTKLSKVFFAISYLKKAALEWFEQGVLEENPRIIGQNFRRNSRPISDQQTQLNQQK